MSRGRKKIGRPYRKTMIEWAGRHPGHWVRRLSDGDHRHFSSMTGNGHVTAWATFHMRPGDLADSLGLDPDTMEALHREAEDEGLLKSYGANRARTLLTCIIVGGLTGYTQVALRNAIWDGRIAGHLRDDLLAAWGLDPADFPEGSDVITATPNRAPLLEPPY